MRLVANIVLLLATVPVFSQEVVDRMVAVVNKQVILQSELDDAAHIEFLLQGKPLSAVTGPEMGAVLDRLIDQGLLQQQIVDNSVLEFATDEVANQIRDVRSKLPGATEDEKWLAMLAAYGVNEQDVALHIAAQLRILKFIDLRFRTLARADRASVANYYNQKLIPELRKQGAAEPPLSQVSDRIEEILTEQRINELLNSWLQALRSQANIEKMNITYQSATGAKP